jgi:hypothetical protein
VIATGIPNVWQHEPADVAARHAEVSAEFPGRFLLGIGIGHREAIGEYTRPLATMRTLFDGLDAAATPVPKEERRAPTTCASRSSGTHGRRSTTTARSPASSSRSSNSEFARRSEPHGHLTPGRDLDRFAALRGLRHGRRRCHGVTVSRGRRATRGTPTTRRRRAAVAAFAPSSASAITRPEAALAA